MVRGRSGNPVVVQTLQNTQRSGEDVRCDAHGSDAPGVPSWAEEMTSGTPDVRRVVLQPKGDETSMASGFACDVSVRIGRGATLVSVLVNGVDDWSEASLDATTGEMIGLSLEGLRETEFAEPARLWNFLPGIGAPIGDGLDRYRVFNIARYRAFSEWFGQTATREGRLPTASCVGHHGRTLAVHALGVRGAGVPVENPRQVPAFEYSTKFGPRPPCFSRAGLVDIDGNRLLLVAGTASVRGEESVHTGSLAAQLSETVSNLRAVVAEGRRIDGASIDEEAPLAGVRATRVYCRRREDLAWLQRSLPRELEGVSKVEFIHADICREELLVEIEIVVDVFRA